MSSSLVSSTPILRRTLVWSAAAAVVVAAIAATIGGGVAGVNGIWSGLAGVVLAVLFLAITAISILVANRWYGQPLYVQLFFAMVLGGWLLKIGLFVVLMLVIRGMPWVSPMVFFLSMIAGVGMSLVVDVIVLTRMHLPVVSDTSLPTEIPEDRVPGSGSVPEAGEGEANSGNSRV